jgi:hypothetical protein
LIHGTLKKAKSFASELEGMTVTELQKLANNKGTLADKARTMLKLIRESEQLIEKQYLYLLHLRLRFLWYC